MSVFQQWGKKQRKPAPVPLPPLESQTDSSAADFFPDGIKVLHDCVDAVVDICFVHGLTGDRDSTWTAHGQTIPWPKTLLAPKLQKARILTYGYDAYVVRKSVAGVNRLIDHANNLIIDLTTDRESLNAASRPLIFVVHSLGGIVCKKAILLSRHHPEPHLRDIFNSLKGIIFLGTPHRGSWMAKWANISARTVGVVKSTNKSLLGILTTDNQFLEAIQLDFQNMLREQQECRRDLRVTCFFEELPLPMAGIVVPKESATLEGYTSVSIHANHRDMVKFESEYQNGFKRLLGELARWESQLGTLKQRPQPHEQTTMDNNRTLNMTSPYIPRKQSSVHFMGRSGYFDRMAEYFQPRDEAEKPGRRVFLLYGPGGFGKTQICLKFAEEYSKKFWRVFWVDATKIETIDSSFYEIGQDLEAKLAGVDGSRKAVCAWLSAQPREWLVILDNADDRHYSLDDAILSGIRSNILISSRNASLRNRVQPDQAMRVGELSYGDAKHLVWSIGPIHQYPTLTTEIDNELGEIVKALHCIPLALSHAASAILSGYCDLWEYRRLLNKERKSMLENPTYRGDSGYNMTLYSAWALTITMLEEQVSSTPSSSVFRDEAQVESMCPAVELLSLLAFFHHSSISADIFRRAATGNSLKEGSHNDERLPSISSDLPSRFLDSTDGSWDSHRFRQAIQTLQAASLIQKDAVQNTWTIHPLVHIWSRERLTVEQQERLALEARYILVRAIANNSGEKNVGFSRQIIPHMAAFRRAMENSNLSNVYADDYVSTFWHTFMAHGYFAEAEVYAMMLKDGRAHCLGQRDRLTLKATETLALTMKENAAPGKLDKSILLLNDLIETRKQCLPKDHPDIVNNQILLGSLHLYRGHMQFSETLLKDAWVTAQDQFGKSHELAIRAATELGSVYIEQRKFELAEPLQRNLLSLAVTRYGECHEKTLGIMGSLAATLNQVGQINESEELKIQILENRIATLGQHHPDTLLAQSNLAATYCQQQKWTEVEEIMLGVTDKRVRLLGNWHRETLRGRIIMTTCYIGQGRFDDAIVECDEAVKGRKATLGCDHPDTLWAMHKQAEAFECKGKIADAINLWTECLSSVRENNGDAQWIAKIVTGRLANAQRSLGHDHNDMSEMC